METSEAMAVLDRAGRGGEVSEVVDLAITSAQAAYRQIDEDETRTAEYRDEELTRAYERHREALNTKLVGMARGAVQNEQRDAVSAFGTSDLPGDRASLVISQRDAADRAATVESREGLMELLSRANRGGDEVLARAVAQRALERLDDQVLNAFLADRPKLDPVVQRLWDAARADNSGGSRLQNTLRLAGLRPSQRAAR